MSHLTRVTNYIIKELDQTTCMTDGDEFWFYNGYKCYIQYNIKENHYQSFRYNTNIVDDISEIFSIEKTFVTEVFLWWLKNLTNLDIQKYTQLSENMLHENYTKYVHIEQLIENCTQINSIELFKQARKIKDSELVDILD